MRGKGEEEGEERRQGRRLLVKYIKISTLLKNTNSFFLSKQGRNIKQPAFSLKYNWVKLF